MELREMADQQVIPEGQLEASSPYELRVDGAKNIPEVDVRAALASGDMGFLHSFTTGSAVDGPGIRVVAWTSGCMWRCRYCHNPDTWKMTNGIPVSVARASAELSKYKRGLKSMAGGLTVSGGEPLMQHRFVLKLFAAARTMGVHTCLDTNGYYGDRVSDEDLQGIDLVLLDLKTFDRDRHIHLVGMDNAPTHTFARRLGELRRPAWVRYVLVPGLTDDPEDLAKTAEFAASLGIVERVDVLPFHQMGRSKWQRLGMEYTLENTQPPTAEVVERTCEIFRKAGLKAY
jgi:pyruvate formate lyase activating enzyme